jgi:hypothetical protein
MRIPFGGYDTPEGQNQPVNWLIFCYWTNIRMTYRLWQVSINSHIILLLMEWDKSAGLFLPVKNQMITW